MLVPQCAKCTQRYCNKKEWNRNQLPEFCPMKYKSDVINNALEKFGKKETKQLYINSAITEQRAYQIVRGRMISVRPRLLEIIKFSKLMQWNRIGIAFCSGLADEAKKVVEILESANFDVCSVVCSCSNADKTVLGVPKEHKIANLYGEPEKFEVGCSPIVQADLLNSENTYLNVIVGLCIGHDILFTKHSDAPVTTLIVKDRVTGHNPIASLYSAYHNPRYYEEKE